MRHRFGNAKLKRDVGARNSLLKNLTTSVVLEERVITTIPKAKAVQPLAKNAYGQYLLNLPKDQVAWPSK